MTPDVAVTSPGHRTEPRERPVPMPDDDELGGEGRGQQQPGRGRVLDEAVDGRVRVAGTQVGEDVDDRIRLVLLGGGLVDEGVEQSQEPGNGVLPRVHRGQVASAGNGRLEREGSHLGVVRTAVRTAVEAHHHPGPVGERARRGWRHDQGRAVGQLDERCCGRAEHEVGHRTGAP
jgi:hypothetical protein